MGKIPGAKETSAIPELISALKADALRDSHYYDPVFDPENSTTYIREGERFQDDLRRFEAVGGLRSFGGDAKIAVPVLEEVANNTTNPELRVLALGAIGTIDPERRAATPEIDQILTAKETGLAIAERIRVGQASFEELLQGLNFRDSVSQAAQAIGKLDQDAIQTALPALRSALTTWGDYDAAQVIKQSDPTRLVAALNEPKAAYEAAEALGELGFDARYALPALYEAMEAGATDNRYAIESAIERIDPQAPKALFHFEDLSPAVLELRTAAEAADKEIHDRILDVYLKHGQDLNNMTRGEVITFANAVHDVDRGMYDLFVKNLVASNPSLAEALKP